MTPMEQEKARRAEADAKIEEGAEAFQDHRPQVHTYADGSQRVGAPPFPELSPLQEEAAQKRAHAEAHGHAPRQGMAIPPGMPQSGAPAPSPAGVGITESAFEAKVQEQLKSDIASGKDPATPNPTTDSNKPELAGTGGEVASADVVHDLTPSDLGKVAAEINPGSDLPRQPTEAEVQAAVTQVAREVKGPVIEDTKPADEKAATTSKSTKK